MQSICYAYLANAYSVFLFRHMELYRLGHVSGLKEILTASLALLDRQSVNEQCKHTGERVLACCQNSIVPDHLLWRILVSGLFSPPESADVQLDIQDVLHGEIEY